MNEELKQLKKDINKKYDAEVMVNATEVAEKDRKIISICPVLDFAVGGIPEGSWVLLSGVPKCGKMQPLTSKVITPYGHTTIGDVKIGQTICAPNHTYAKIVDIFDNGLQPVYKIVFENGDVVRCGLEHLWQVKTRDHNNYLIKTTQDIMLDLYEPDGRPKWQIILPICKFDAQLLPIPPYTMGALLGDGGFTATSRSITFTTLDQEIIDYINNELEDGYQFVLVKDSNKDYRLKCNNQPNIYTHKLKDLQLYGHGSHTKFIPDVYKFNTIENRIALLQGLMDTDGTISKRGHCSFSSTSLQLANDVKEIVLSLGGIAKVVSKTTTCNGKVFQSYTCHIRFNITKNLFRLTRKINRCQIRTKQPLSRKIVNIIFDNYEQCKCIQIDKIDGLYITDNYIVTHNTTTALQIAANAQQQFDKQIFIGNVEHRINKKELSGIHGLDISKIEMIQSKKGKILMAQDHLQEYTHIIKTVPGCVLIIDSSSALCAEKEFSEDITAQARNEGPKLLATFCRKMASIVPVQDVTLIIIQHLIANTSGYGSPFYEDGGNKIQYQADIKLRCTSFQKWNLKQNDDSTRVGQVANWQVVTSSLGPPGSKVQSYIRYGYGIDDIKEYIDLGLDMAVIDKAGTWYTFKDVRGQGEEKMRNALLENPERLQELKDAVNAHMHL